MPRFSRRNSDVHTAFHRLSPLKEGQYSANSMGFLAPLYIVLQPTRLERTSISLIGRLRIPSINVLDVDEAAAPWRFSGENFIGGGKRLMESSRLALKAEHFQVHGRASTDVCVPSMRCTGYRGLYKWHYKGPFKSTRSLNQPAMLTTQLPLLAGILLSIASSVFSAAAAVDPAISGASIPTTVNRRCIKPVIRKEW